MAEIKPSLRIGERGTLEGDELEVLGLGIWRDTEGYGYVEYALRDEHGRAWALEEEEGHFVLYRDVQPGPTWPQRPLTPRAKRRFAGRTWRGLGANIYRLTRRDGEFWKELPARVAVASCSYYAPPRVCAQSRIMPDGEWTWSDGVYVPWQDIEGAFTDAVLTAPRASGHPAKPVPAQPWLRALLPAAVVVALLSLAVAMGSLAVRGEHLAISRQIAMASNVDEVVVGGVTSTGRGFALIKAEAEMAAGDWATVTLRLKRLPDQAAPSSTNAPPKTSATELVVRGDVGQRIRSSGSQLTLDTLSLRARKRLPAGRWMVLASWKLGPSRRGGVPRLRVSVAQAGVRVGGLFLWSLLLLLGAAGATFAVLVRRLMIINEELS